MEIIILAVIALVGLILGAVITFLFLKMLNKGKADAIVKEAEAEAEVIKKDKMLQAKERFLQLIRI